MTAGPFLKWAGGKRWLIERQDFALPAYSGRYIEPFLGGGAVFFNLRPPKAILSDLNPRLIETYKAIQADWELVASALRIHQRLHSKEHYYAERARTRQRPHTRAAQFLYLNRACWNGLYRENLSGQFNVPIGTKTNIVLDTDDFNAVSTLLTGVELLCSDFEPVIERATRGDIIFADPPYTTAHNFNGFIKYNQRMFSWNDQIRLRDALFAAANRGAKVVVTNADHQSVSDLYRGASRYLQIERSSVISGNNVGRNLTTEAIFFLE
ncbi:MAG: Dam family site-specific DNA-(adenine-N6)-methyltransferase [Hyphomicrobiales bacterium]|nr:Dam family site-specific DNA-(adenine-N6)-methyltransferase [Hyphomicrobiales bacterium]